MPHTPLLRALVSRRSFTKSAAGTLLAAGAGRALGGAPASARIVVVGAGIGGLTAALQLADAGVTARVFDSADHVGGRMRSHRGFWADGQVTEWCGELIDSSHTTMRALAARFALELDDLTGAEPAGATETYFFAGERYGKAQADADFAALLPRLQTDADAAGDISYESSTPAGRALDNLSVYDWIATRVAGGHASPLGRLLDAAYTIEYGAPTCEQSALNLIAMLADQPEGEGGLTLFGTSDERYHIRGGNQRLPEAIAAALPRVETGERLERLARNADGTSTLTFARGFSRHDVVADAVILALPFATLRHVDLARAGFDALKLEAIRELGRGRSGKLHLQFDRRPWNEAGPWGVGTGTSYSDRGYQSTWEPTRAQPGNGGILVNFTGGDAAAAGRGPAFATDAHVGVRLAAHAFLGQIEPVFPGLSAAWTGRASRSLPHRDPHLGLSYSYWRVGQVQRIAGYERVAQGRVFFAGEHCSTDCQGYMEGAAVEGARAADEALAALKPL